MSIWLLHFCYVIDVVTYEFLSITYRRWSRAISYFRTQETAIHADADDVQNGSDDDNADGADGDFSEGTFHR